MLTILFWVLFQPQPLFAGKTPLQNVPATYAEVYEWKLAPRIGTDRYYIDYGGEKPAFICNAKYQQQPFATKAALINALEGHGWQFTGYKGDTLLLKRP